MNKNNRVFYAVMAIIAVFISSFSIARAELIIKALDPVTGEPIQDITNQVNVQYTEAPVTEVEPTVQVTTEVTATSTGLAPRTSAAMLKGIDSLLAATPKDASTESCAALLDAFNKSPEEVRASYAWNKGSYSTNLDARPDLTGSQGKLYEAIRKTQADITAKLDGISATGDDAEYARVAQLKAIVRSSLVSLAMEVKKEGGPSVDRVNSLLALSSGALSCMPSDTATDAGNKSSLTGVQDSLVSLNGSWDEEKANYGASATTAVSEQPAEMDVNVAFKEPAKFLGFIRSNISAKAVVHPDGTVSLKRPWYKFLFSQKDKVNLDEVNAAISEAKLDLASSASAEERSKALEQLTTLLNAVAAPSAEVSADASVTTDNSPTADTATDAQTESTTTE